MPDYPIPLNETERLAALREYRILDTGPEQAYDDLVQLASMICDTPMATITLIDEDRQWFKARIGMSESQTPRSDAICAHAILEPRVFIVPDARLDSRFAALPGVTGAPHIRYYAGAPLLTANGTSLGTICVIDSVPRTLSEAQQAALTALSRLVVGQLELRKSAAALASALDRVHQLSGLLPICAHCKRIREGGDYWSEVESYLRKHAPVEFSHGICPACLVEHYSDLGLDDSSRKRAR